MKVSHTHHRHELVYFTDTIHFSHLEVFRFIFIPSPSLISFSFYLSVFLSLFLSYSDRSLLVLGGFLLYLITIKRNTHTHTHTHTHTQKRRPCHPMRIRTRNPKKRAAADPRLRPNVHRNRLSLIPAAKRNISLSVRVYLCDASN
jgi:hypothetical protein